MKRRSAMPPESPSAPGGEARPVCPLRFVDGRRIEPLVRRLPHDAAFETAPLFAHLHLAAHELRQLCYVFRSSSSRPMAAETDGALTDEEIRRGTYRFFEESGEDVIRDALLSVPIEWWNLIDQGGAVHYQLWLFGAGDAGFVFMAGTTEPVARFGQGTWLETFPGPILGLPGSRATPPELAQQIATALAVFGEDAGAIERWLSSELSRIQLPAP